jgi:hypothetical protein
MSTPIFYPFFGKNYIVQTRHKYSAWQDHDSYRSLSQAEQAVQELMRRNPEIEAQVFSRLTGQVVRTYARRKK